MTEPIPEAEAYLRFRLEEMSSRNEHHRFEELAKRDPKVKVVSVEQEMLNDDGKPRPELFREDGLHMNDKGYAIWNKKLRPYVETTAGSR